MRRVLSLALLVLSLAVAGCGSGGANTWRASANRACGTYYAEILGLPELQAKEHLSVDALSQRALADKAQFVTALQAGVPSSLQPRLTTLVNELRHPKLPTGKTDLAKVLSVARALKTEYAGLGLTTCVASDQRGISRLTQG